MNPNEIIYQERFNNLNKSQQEATQIIYGPVMVIAGPGTGKTEVLALRIACLLTSDAMVQPQEILCLTYTDEAANNMRKRLLEIVGVLAHKITIGTFHSFCNQVIQTFPDLFSYRQLQLITELEETEIIHEILENLTAQNPVFRNGPALYMETKKLLNLFNLFKKENIKPEQFIASVDQYLNDLHDNEDFYYKRKSGNFNKGDFKQADYDEVAKNMRKSKAAALLFDTYNNKMKEKGLFDYQDMLLWVIDELSKNEFLRSHYQERFQYLLVDEFQDTNGAQNELIALLTLGIDNPNIFVVGDDDQCVYEFQGARSKNILDFVKKYQSEIQIVVLEENYRSSQAILNAALTSIQHNEQRLVTQLKDLNLKKDLIAANARFSTISTPVKPVVAVYQNILQEEIGIVLAIEELQKKGVPLNQIAVIYHKNKEALNIIRILNKKGIPYWIKKPVDILRTPLVEQIIQLLYYLQSELEKPYSGAAYLFQMLYAPYFNIAPLDIAELSFYLQKQPNKEKKAWRFILNNGLLLQSLNLKNIDALLNFGSISEAWIRDQTVLSLPLLIEKIMHESGMIAYVLQSEDRFQDIQILNQFFEFVKESYNSQNHIKLPAFLAMIEKMYKEKLPLNLYNLFQPESGVQFYTAHSSKGNEFEYVFLIGCTKNNWEESKNGGSQKYSLPDNLTFINNSKEEKTKQQKIEVSRRLFFVAITRAKQYLQISYAAKSNDQKTLLPSLFITEIEDQTIVEEKNIAPEELIQNMAWVIPLEKTINYTMEHHPYVKNRVQQFVMSFSALSKYLECPLSFYYDYILTVPALKGDTLSFGSAIHKALELYFIEFVKSPAQLPSVEYLVSCFEKSMQKEIENFTPLQWKKRMEQGKDLLINYFQYYHQTWTPQVAIEVFFPKIFIDDMPLKGKIDKIIINDNGCTVVDYKTGVPDAKKINAHLKPPSEKEEFGGDYWRQMTFYKLLLDHDPEKKWKMKNSIFDFVEQNPDTKQYTQAQIIISETDVETLKIMMKQAYKKINNHEFDKGCGKEHCHWCNFALRYKLTSE